ncbi:MAG: 4Fe-4S cluster-binding domain-containing protein [Deltaproteobacteria bacterium]|nr:4Fe-4S cluster-binding domain-containing protein [Deltaproteobacteria bacterium]
MQDKTNKPPLQPAPARFKRGAREGKLNLHAVIPASRVNGPGTRLVVFFQGCERRCYGCFNPDTHPFEKRLAYGVNELFERHLSGRIEGMTVSGGEPFMQAKGLQELLECAQTEHGLSTVVYTGFRLEDIRLSKYMSAALPFIDLLVDGAYNGQMPEPTLLARGSTNQSFCFLTDRYCLDNLYMPAKAEITISPDGTVTGTGFGRTLQLPRPAESR